MLVEKPELVRHASAAGNAAAIYGVDAHPTRELFATAGGDGSVKIWALAPDDDGEGVATFELLATLSFHEQAVNCVRWAGHGRYLASGSDDHLVVLYELQPGPPPPVPFGSNAQRNKQNWGRCATLKRHTMDVQDVAWSPDDRLLATCSIDNSICIWAVDNVGTPAVMTQPLQTLMGHNGWVKGVAWDPVGKYLTSAGEDKTVRVWRVDSWKEEQVVSEPFAACASTSHFRRLSWAPDGSMLCATHAFTSKKNIGAILDRTTWTNEVKFVGHQGMVTCARFNPKLLVHTETSADTEFACCALGGDDATVSIWLAHLARPLTVIKDCFDAAVTDLSWSVASSMLIASSLDGSICCFQLGDEELGSPISDARQSKLLQTKYGSRAGVTLASTFVENPTQLQLEETSAAAALPTPSVTTKKPSTAATGTNTLIAKRKPSTVVAAKTDKKRIAPVLIPTQPEQGRAAEALPPRPMVNPASVSNKIQNILGPTLPDGDAGSNLMDERMAGKSENVKAVASQQDQNTGASGSAATDKRPVVSNTAASGASSKPSGDAKRSRDISLKRKRDGDRERSRASTASNSASAVLAKTREVTPQAAKVLQQSAENAQPLLPAFPFRLSFSVEIDVSHDTPSTKRKPTHAIVEVTVHNMKGTSVADAVELGVVYTSIKCTGPGNNVRWIDRVPGRVVAVAGNTSTCAFSTANGDLYLVSMAGRRLFPCISLGNAVSMLECGPRKSAFVMVILVSGVLKMWDIAARKVMLNDSIEPLTTSSYSSNLRLTLLRCSITAIGSPVVTFATSNPETRTASVLQTFTFDNGMQSWMRVADDSFVYSDFNTSLSTESVNVREIPMGALRRLQNASGYSRTQRGTSSEMLREMADPLVQRNVTRAHLEHQMATSVVLQSPSEYQYWLQAYVRFLASDEDVTRLEELCQELMGPFHSPRGPDALCKMTVAWQPRILDLAKRTLLRSHVLPAMAANRTLQRVVAKYQLMLSEMDAADGDTSHPGSSTDPTGP